MIKRTPDYYAEEWLGDLHRLIAMSGSDKTANNHLIMVPVRQMLGRSLFMPANIALIVGRNAQRYVNSMLQNRFVVRRSGKYRLTEAAHKQVMLFRQIFGNDSGPLKEDDFNELKALIGSSQITIKHAAMLEFIADGVCRFCDIRNLLGVTDTSVRKRINVLLRDGYIKRGHNDDRGAIILTEKGARLLALIGKV